MGVKAPFFYEFLINKSNQVIEELNKTVYYAELGVILWH